MNKLSLLVIGLTLFSNLIFSQESKLVSKLSKPSLKFSGYIGRPGDKITGPMVSEFDYQTLVKECTFFGGDSLAGFDFNQNYLTLLGQNFKLYSEFRSMMFRAQSDFVKNKYNLPMAPGMPVNGSYEPPVTLASSCANLDFEDGNLTNWVISTGYNTNSNGNLTTAGAGTSATNQDIYNCADVNLISAAYGNDAIGFPGLDPNGGSYSARVGGFHINTADDGIGGFACDARKHDFVYSNGEILEQTFVVTAANALISYDYAVVLNDGGHANGQQPYFHVYVKNAATGAVLSTCTQYYVQAPAGSAPPGFSNSGFVNSVDGSILYYKNWTSNSINLTPYIGQNVNVEFVAAGCTAGAHMGWAYVDVTCGPATINMNTNPCSGSPVVMTAPNISGGSYLWSGPGVTGATTQTVSVSSNGTYSVAVTPSQGAACSYTLTRTISFATTPTITASVSSSTLCSGSSSTITPSGGTTYTLVNTGATGTSFNVSPTSNTTYTIIGTDATTCTKSTTTTVSVTPTPTVSAISAPSSSVCAGTTVTLTPSGATTYTLLNTGSTGTSFAVSPSSSTTYSIVGATSGCTSNTITTAINVNSPVLTPAFTNTTLCQGNTTTLTVTGTPSSPYVSFSNGTDYAIPDNNTGGVTSNITVSGLSGTVGTSLVSVNLSINHTFDADLDIFLVCPSGNTITLSDDNGGSGANYTNTTFSTTGTAVTAGAAPFTGVYTPEQPFSGLSGCTTNGVWKLFVRDDAGSDVGTLLNWSLTFSNQNTYSWAPSTVAPTTGTNVVASPTTTTVYTVTATDATGCSIAKTVTVNVNPIPSPTITATNTLCLGSTATFTGSGASTYTWSSSANGGLAATTGSVVSATPTASGNITYTVLVTAANSCTNIASKTITVNPTPTANAGTGGTLTCNTSTLSLSGSGGGTYSWTGPASGIVSGSTTATPVVSVQGTYSLTVTAAGCTSTVSTVAISQNTVAPAVTAVPSGSLNCTTTTVNIVASTTATPISVVWSGTGITSGAATQTVYVNQPGTFNYTVTNTSTGCKTTGSQAISQNTAVPTMSISSSQTLACGGAAATLTGAAIPANSAPVWTGGVTAGANSYTATASTPNVYTLTVTDPSNNCSASMQTTVAPSMGLPSATIAISNSITCSQSTATISATTNPSSSVTYTWSGSGITSGVNSTSVAVNASGNYTFVVQNSLSPTCISTVVATMPLNNTPPSPTASSTLVLTCAASNSVSPLNGGPASGVTYTWTGPGVASGANSQNATANAPGQYTLSVTSTVNGCTNTAVTTVTQNITPPSPTATSTLVMTCAPSNSVSPLNGMPASGVTYTWSGPSVTSGVNSQNAVASAPGTYTLKVTDAVNSCTASAVTTVTQNITPPSPTASSTLILTCASSNSVSPLNGMPASGVTYTWTGPSVVSGANSQNAVAGAPGTYTLKVTDAVNSCTASAVTTVTQNITPPSPTAVASGSLNCTTAMVTLTATPGSGVTYQWNGFGITGSSTNATAQATISGVYTVQVTDNTNNCSATATVNIPSDYSSPSATASNNTTLTCTTTTALVTGGPLSGVTYTWTGPGITTSVNSSSIIVNQPGSYDLVITNTANGCTNSAHTDVIQDITTPTVTIANPSMITCSSPTIGLSGSPASGVTYTWSGPGIVSGGSTATPSVNLAGTYTLGATNTSNGCSASNTILVSSDLTVITPTIAVPAVLNCSTTSQVLTGFPGSGVTYTWSGTGITAGGNTSSPTINQPGTYTLSITNNANGCKGTETVTVTRDITPPTVSAMPTNSLNCTNTITTVALTTTTSPVAYTWSGSGIQSGNGTGTITVNQGGTFNYTVTNTVNSCTVAGSQSVIQNTTAPTVTASNTGSLNCSVTSVNVAATTTASPVSYNWSGTGITSATNISTIAVNGVGPYNYSVTSTFNNCITTGSMAIVQNTTAPTTTASTTGSVTCVNNTINLNSTLAGMNYTWTAPAGSTVLSGTNLQNASGSGLGTYTLNVLNPANSCTFQTTIAAIQNTTTPTSVNAGPDQALVCVTPTVALTGSATPASATANWLGGVSSPNSFTTSTGAAGTYTLQAIEPTTGCFIQDVVTVSQSINSPTVTSNPVTNSITCTNSVVAIGISVTDPSGFTVAWPSGTGISGPTNSVTTTATLTGVYQVTVTSQGNGCISINSINVPIDQSPVNPTITPATSITCNNPTATLDVVPVGLNYTYAWTGSGITSGANTTNPVVDAGGVYTVVVTNTVNGCSGSSTVNVPVNVTPPTVNIGTASYTTTCANPSATISISSTPASGVTYSWTAPATGSLDTYTVTNPVASGSGIFTVVATNTVNGCSSSLTQNTVEIVPDAALPIVTMSSNSAEITCAVTTPTVNAAVSTNSVSYVWTPTVGIVPGTETTGTPAFNQAGTYSLVVTNTVTGCATETNANVVNVTLNNTVPTVSLTSATNDGTLTCSVLAVNVTPTISPSSDLTYTWTSSSGSGISTPVNQANATFTASGTYTLAVTNTVTGCVNVLDATSTFTVYQNINTPTVTVAAVSSNTSIGCSGSGTVVTLGSTITAANATTISWLPGGASTPTLDVTTAGIYTVEVVDAVNSCSATAQYTVSGSTNTPTINMNASAAIPCGATTASLTSITTPSTGVTYAWTGPATAVISSTNTPSTTVDQIGNYTLTVVDGSTGCSSSATVEVVQGNVTASFTPDTYTGVAPLTVNFTNNSTGATSFNWTYGDGNSQVTTSMAPTANTFTASGTYTVTLVASSGACSDTYTATIVVEDPLSLFIPNVFTPNNDGTNDVFTIKATGVKELSLQIFNRWGEKLYEFAGDRAAWDGKVESGANVPEGTYFYFVKATGFDGKEIEKNGPLTLFR